MPLTREQFQKARNSGFSFEQIIGFEKQREANPQFTKIAESPDVQRMAHLLRTMPFYRRGASLMSGKPLEEIDRTLNAIPEPANTFGNALFKALPDIAMASPVLKGVGAIPKIWPVAKTALGLGAYGGARAAGQNQLVLPAVAQSVAFGMLGHGLGRAATTALPKIPLRGNIGSALGWGATGAALSSPEDRMQSAIFGAGMGALSPSKPLGKTKGQYLGEAINEYRTILRPTQSEIKNIEIRKGKNINDYYRLAAEEQLPLKQSADKKLDTVMAREKLEPKQSAIHEKLNEQLQANPAKQFDLFEIGRKAKTELRQSIKNDTEYINAAKDVDNFIRDAVKARGRYLNGQQLNDFKQGMWSVSYNQLQPNTQGTARKIGFIAKESIENAYPKSSIKELNELSGKYATLDILLQKAHGRTVSGGQLGRRFAETTGALAGFKIPFVGPIAGRYAGGKVSDYLYAPERASQIAGKKAQKAGIVGESFRRTMGQAPNPSKNLLRNKSGQTSKGLLGPTMATGVGLAAALKATAARGETGESLDPKYKQQIANAENYGKVEGDWAQIEDIVLRDLKRIGKLKQNITLEQVRKDPQLYDKVAKLYWDRLDAFGIPEKDKALWWLMPGRYRQTGGDISRLKNPEHRNIMQNRVKNIGRGK